MRAAVVSHTYVIEANRGKLTALSRIPGTELLLIVPSRWTNSDLHQTTEPSSESGSLETMPLKAWPTRFASLLTYSPFGIMRLLRRFRPHVVHFEEEPWSVAALETAFVCWRLQIPFVFFTWENIDRRLPPPFGWIRRFVIRRAAAAVAGNVEAKRVLERHGFRRPISVLAQLGVDPERFSPVEPAETRDPPVVGFIGRLVPQKGVLVLLDAVARLSTVRALLVGNGPLKETVRARAHTLGLDGRLELRDDVRHHEVPEQLRRMSVLVLPSLTTPRWKEQFGHVLIEAMACGVPVIGSDSGAIPEVVGEAGVVVKEGDVGALAAMLGDLLANRARRAELAARGRRRVLAEYADDVVARRLLTVWQRVVPEAG